MHHAESNTILLLRKTSARSTFNSGEWEMGYGRKNALETIPGALRREVREETAITDFRIVQLLRVWHFFRGAREVENEILGVSFWCQTPQRDVTLSSEHSEYRWVTVEEALRLVKVDGLLLDLKIFQKALMSPGAAVFSDPDAKVFDFL